MKTTKTKGSDKIGAVASIILCILLIPIIIINTFMIIQTYTNPDHMPSVFGISPVVVLSGSMSPTFDTEALIFIKDVDANTLEKGDIICYLQGSTAVTHRIEEVVVQNGQKTFVTKGDANNTIDRLAVSPMQIEGKYIGHINGAGGAVMFMQSTTGMIVFILLPILIYLGYDLIIRKKESDADKKRAAELEAEIAALKADKKD